MPPSITQSQLLPILGAIVAFLIAALLVLYIFRLLFGRRIKAPGPRNRARRLDIIDTFDLDRERQLVIIRRDNTEHLLMIGGPNDVLIEPSITRVEGRDVRPVALREAAREKEGAAAAQGWPAAPGHAPEPAHVPSHTPPGPVPGTSPTSEQARRKTIEAGPPSGPHGLPPLPPDLFAPAPPKPAPPEAPSRPAPRFPPPPAPPRAGGPGLTPPRPAPARPSTPPFFARPQRPAGTPAAPPPAPSTPQEAPPAPKEAPPAPAEKPPAPPPPEAAPTPKPTETPDPLESLEAEMARLLGRPDSKP